MDEISLYYPYFHVRDDAWLKAAALYLPQVARVRPLGYPVHDSPTAAVLRDELDFLRDVAPEPWAAAVAQDFLALLKREERALVKRYRVSRDPYREGFGAEVDNPWYQDETRFAWIHTSQLGVPAELYSPRKHPLVQYMHDVGLGVITRFDPLTGVRDDTRWIGMHPHMVAVYSCALANRIGEANALTPVTHDPRLFALPSHWTVEELAAALLQNTRPTAGGQATTLYACTAVQTVLPADIEHVPVEKIVRARQILHDEFEAFRAHIDALGEEFARIEGIEEPGILQSRLESMAERDLVKPAHELERGLRSLGLEPVRAVFGLKSLELPAIAALAAHTAHISPVVGAGGVIALQLVSATRAARRAAIRKRTSAAGYLLGLRRELNPVGTLARVRRALFGSS
jgi:hypothetical protein